MHVAAALVEFCRAKPEVDRRAWLSSSMSFFTGLLTPNVGNERLVENPAWAVDRQLSRIPQSKLSLVLSVSFPLVTFFPRRPPYAFGPIYSHLATYFLDSNGIWYSQLLFFLYTPFFLLLLLLLRLLPLCAVSRVACPICALHPLSAGVVITSHRRHRVIASKLSSYLKFSHRSFDPHSTSLALLAHTQEPLLSIAAFSSVLPSSGSI
jgi:hypothetical protein